MLLGEEKRNRISVYILILCRFFVKNFILDLDLSLPGQSGRPVCRPDKPAEHQLGQAGRTA